MTSGLRSTGQRERPLAAVGLQQLEAERREQVAQQRAVVGVVVHHEDRAALALDTR